MELWEIIKSQKENIKYLGNELSEIKERYCLRQLKEVSILDNKLFNEIIQLAQKIDLQEIACKDKYFTSIETLIQKVHILSNQLKNDYQKSISPIQDSSNLSKSQDLFSSPQLASKDNFGFSHTSHIEVTSKVIEIDRPRNILKHANNLASKTDSKSKSPVKNMKNKQKKVVTKYA